MKIEKVHEHVSVCLTSSSGSSDLYATFGTPFLLLIRQGESFSTVKERIRTKLDVPEKEFEKWRFCVICHVSIFCAAFLDFYAQ